MTLPLRFLCLALCLLVPAFSNAQTPPEEGLRLAVFDVDATPPKGSQMAYDPMKASSPLSLRCRGIAVLPGGQKPVVLVAVDWIGIANEAHSFFRETLAKAAGTDAERVSVHVLHQHDAPICDFTSERLLREHGKPAGPFASGFQREMMARAAEALKASLEQARPVTEVGFGEAPVREVASNRRIPGPDGKIRAVRFTATKDPALRAEPEGVIDPILTALSFWEGDGPLAVLTYYAVHPQSYYRTGVADPDFPGIARFLREQAMPGVALVHFNGAAGNLGAGKYNDGHPENRPVLAQRLADGMKRAFEATKKQPVTAADVTWRVERAALPLSPHLNEEGLRARLAGAGGDSMLGVAMQLAWLERQRAGHQVEIGCLGIGDIRVLHMPGELFVEYQLAAKAARADRRVAMAAYGDYGPAYIGTARAYEEGGYETEPRSSFVAPEVEPVLLEAIRRLVE